MKVNVGYCRCLSSPAVLLKFFFYVYTPRHNAWIYNCNFDLHECLNQPFFQCLRALLAKKPPFVRERKKLNLLLQNCIVIISLDETIEKTYLL